VVSSGLAAPHWQGLPSCRGTNAIAVATALLGAGTV
jgi:hypothetical protein